MKKAITLKDREGNEIYPCPFFPVGSIYITVLNINPSTYFGGIWERFANGRVLVGVDENQNEFAKVNKTGGNKNLQRHNHTTNSSGDHTHNINFDQVWSWGGTTSIATTSGGPYGGSGFVNSSGEHTHVINESGSGDSGNLQPYIAVYMWRRVT